MRNLKMILFVLLVMANYNISSAQKPAVVLNDKSGWHKIGETTVNFTTENDQILVIGANKFSAVKIKVTDAPVNFKSFEIHFDKGNVQNIAIGQNIKSPGETKDIQLDGDGERIIKKVTFTYHTANANASKKAHIELWGLKTNPDKNDK
ncbi:hypothetical protein [Flavobacterium sp. 3-210]